MLSLDSVGVFITDYCKILFSIHFLLEKIQKHAIMASRIYKIFVKE